MGLAQLAKIGAFVLVIASTGVVQAAPPARQPFKARVAAALGALVGTQPAAKPVAKVDGTLVGKPQPAPEPVAKIDATKAMIRHMVGLKLLEHGAKIVEHNGVQLMVLPTGERIPPEKFDTYLANAFKKVAEEARH